MTLMNFGVVETFRIQDLPQFPPLPQESVSRPSSDNGRMYRRLSAV